MKTIRYSLSFVELGGLLLFLRDYEWKPMISRNRILARYIYDTCKQLYERIEKTGLQLIAEKQMEKSTEVDLTELEVLTIAIMSKRMHSNPNVKYSVNKIIMDLPPEIRNYLEPSCPPKRNAKGDNNAPSKKTESKILQYEKADS